MTEQKLQRRINFLTSYIIVSTLLFLLLFMYLYNKTSNGKLDELTTKRINLIGEDGSLRMVLSNETRQHSGIINGKKLPERYRPAGIIFFDNNGNECGGLTYDETKENGKTKKGMSFTMDNYKNDQVVQLVDDESYEGNIASIRRGFVVNEFPVGADMSVLIDKMDSLNKIKDTSIRNKQLQILFQSAGSKRRLFLGRTLQNQSGIFLYDNSGKPRLEIFVDSSGNPQIVSLDAAGKSKNLIF